MIANHRICRARLPKQAEDPDRIVIDEGPAFGQAAYDQRHILDPSVTSPAGAG